MLDTTKKQLNGEVEEIYKIVLEKTTNLIIVINDNFQIEYCNKEQHKQLLGYSIEEIIGKTPMDFMYQKDINITLKALKNIFDGNEEKTEIKLKCKDNSYKWFEIKGKKIEGKKSVIIAREISRLTSYKQKSKEKEIDRNFQDLCDSLTEISFWKLFQPKDSKVALEKSLEMLEFVINNIPEYIAWKDKNLTYLGSNINFAKEIGVKNPTELVGKSNFDLLANETLALEFNRKEKRVMDLDKPEYRTIETWLKSNDKKLMFETNRIPLHNAEGNVVGILITYDDITIRRLAEEALHESEEKYRHLFNSTPYAVWLFDLEGNLINCNSTTDHLLSAHKKEDLIGKNYKEVFAILGRSKQLMPIFEEQKGHILKDKETKASEFQLTRIDGKKLWLDVRSSLVKLEEKSFFQIIIQDITEKKIAEQNLRESEEKLKRLNKELEQKVLERTKELRESEAKLKEQNIELKKLDEIKNDFITIAAHELKTPLISIAGYTDYILISHGNDIDSEIREDLLIVQRNIERLHKLMNQLLDSLKIDENRLELEKLKVDVGSLIYNCLEELTYQIKEKNHEIIVDIDNDIVLNVDSMRISHVFSNLITNAIKFTENDGMIEISAKKKKDRAIFKVKDNGVGLTEKELESIFQKFAMIKQDTDIKQDGTGLGLYITKGIIEAHGGKIWVNSEGRNKGTTFTFDLPY